MKVFVVTNNRNGGGGAMCVILVAKASYLKPNPAVFNRGSFLSIHLPITFRNTCPGRLREGAESNTLFSKGDPSPGKTNCNVLKIPHYYPEKEIN